MRHLVLVAVTLIICSCTTIEKEYIVQPLPLPESLTTEQLPTEADLECLSDDAYGKVVGIHKRVRTLEDLIKTTH